MLADALLARFLPLKFSQQDNKQYIWYRYLFLSHESHDNFLWAEGKLNKLQCRTFEISVTRTNAVKYLDTRLKISSAYQPSYNQSPHGLLSNTLLMSRLGSSTTPAARSLGCRTEHKHLWTHNHPSRRCSGCWAADHRRRPPQKVRAARLSDRANLRRFHRGAIGKMHVNSQGLGSVRFFSEGGGMLPLKAGYLPIVDFPLISATLFRKHAI